MIVDPALAHRDAKHDAETGRWSLSARARASGNWSGNRVGATDFTCADPSQQCTERQAAAAPWFVCPCPHLGYVGAVALAWSSCVVLVYACMVLALDPHARNSVYARLESLGKFTVVFIQRSIRGMIFSA
jgi:hypothetical protein